MQVTKQLARVPTQMINKVSEGVSGSCYCRGVQFSIAADAQIFWSGYCHCEDCRRAHAAPIYQAVYFVKEKFEITSGSDLLKWYTHEESLRDTLQRYFCGRCGTRVFNALRYVVDDKEVDTIGTFPSLFNEHYSAADKKWAPRFHSYCRDAVMNLPQLHDDLPRNDGHASGL